MQRIFWALLVLVILSVVVVHYWPAVEAWFALRCNGPHPAMDACQGLKEVAVKQNSGKLMERYGYCLLKSIDMALERSDFKTASALLSRVGEIGDTGHFQKIGQTFAREARSIHLKHAKALLEHGKIDSAIESVELGKTLYEDEELLPFLELEADCRSIKARQHSQGRGLLRRSGRTSEGYPARQDFRQSQ